MIAEMRVAQDHGAYPGHFPGLPILPGAALLDEVLEALARARAIDLLDWQVASVKFQDIVRPGDPLELEYDVPRATTIRFTVRSADRTIAVGALSAVARGSGAPDGS